MKRPWEVSYGQRFRDRKPKVFVGIVSFRDIYASVFESWLHWATRVGAQYRDKFEVFYGVSTRQEQYRARNTLVTQAMLGGADFLLMVDDDHTVGDCPDMLGHFYDARKPFQGGLYIQRRGDKEQPVILEFDEETQHCRWIGPENTPSRSCHVDIIGGGINWFDMSLFDFMAEPHWWPRPDTKCWFEPHPRYGLDMHWCLKLEKRLGIRPWLNMDVVVGHVSTTQEILRPAQARGVVICPECSSMVIQRDGRYDCPGCGNVATVAA